MCDVFMTRTETQMVKASEALPLCKHRRVTAFKSVIYPGDCHISCTRAASLKVGDTSGSNPLGSVCAARTVAAPPAVAPHTQQR